MFTSDQIEMREMQAEVMRDASSETPASILRSARRGDPVAIRQWNRMRDDLVRGRHGYQTSRGSDETSLPLGNGYVIGTPSAPSSPAKRNPNEARRKASPMGSKVKTTRRVTPPILPGRSQRVAEAQALAGIGSPAPFAAGSHQYALVGAPERDWKGQE